MYGCRGPNKQAASLGHAGLYMCQDKITSSPLHLAQGAAMTAMAASAALGGQRDSPALPLASAAEAVLDCLGRACHPSLCGPSGRGFAVSVLDEVQALLHCGRPAVVCALTDLRRAFAAAVAEAGAAKTAARQTAERPSGSRESLMNSRTPEGAVTGGSRSATEVATGAASSGAAELPGVRVEGGAHGVGRGSKGSSALRRRLQAAERKLAYFQSWANEQRAPELQIILTAVASEGTAHRCGCY